jgi:hypothetical protein
MAMAERVLVVEDEPEVRSVLKAMLTEAGFEVIAAKDGASALRELWRRKGEVQLVVTDVDRPDERNGACRVHPFGVSRRAHLVHLRPARSGERTGESRTGKPFGPSALVEAVQKAIATRS